MVHGLLLGNDSLLISVSASANNLFNYRHGKTEYGQMSKAGSLGDLSHIGQGYKFSPTSCQHQALT